ncbi:MAG: radical SAM protein [Chloroflexi bacterium]|nr:radical SAM protein [Chloroflexota bacterium]
MNLRQLFNLYRKGDAYFKRKVAGCGYPDILAIELTNACMMDCEMCPRSAMSRRVGFISPELFQRVIDESKGYTEWVWLHHMGDPLLHPQAADLISYAKSKRVKTRLSTNPYCIDQELAIKLLDSGLDLIHISLDGTDAETYRSIRGPRADYDQAVSNINRFLDLKLARKSPIIVQIAIIRMRKTNDQIDCFIELWTKPGIDRVVVKEFNTWDGSQPNITSLGVYDKAAQALQYSCKHPWLNVVILWDGRVIPCCNDYDGKLVLGDLNSQTLQEIWDSPAARKLREQLTKHDYSDNPTCGTCLEKRGAPASRFFPFNRYVWERLLAKAMRRVNPHEM